jgi:beta-lactamase superfamily II metal-dependent hydrolase
VLDSGELPLAATQSRRAPSKAALDEPALISAFPGGAVLLRLPGGAHGLVDCGMEAASQIIACLDARQVDTLDFLAVSHWHFDRYSGILSVLSALKRVRRLLLPSFPGKYRRKLGRKLLDPIETAGLAHFRIGELAVTNARWVIWQLGDGAPAAARVEAYAANMNDPEVVRLAARGHGLENINDFCTVFRVVVGSRSFLLTADATFPCWDRLFRRLVGPGESLRADGLTVPHHGNRRALSQDLLAAIAEPAGFYAVVDPAPRWNFPQPEALALLRAGNGEILVSESALVHLLLTRDGLFERRFALGAPPAGAPLSGDPPRFTINR